MANTGDCLRKKSVLSWPSYLQQINLKHLHACKMGQSCAIGLCKCQISAYFLLQNIAYQDFHEIFFLKFGSLIFLLLFVQSKKESFCALNAFKRFKYCRLFDLISQLLSEHYEKAWKLEWCRILSSGRICIKYVSYLVIELLLLDSATCNLAGTGHDWCQDHLDILRHTGIKQKEPRSFQHSHALANYWTACKQYLQL